MNIAILILAAGSSSRMQTPKQLLPVRDKTLLGISIEHAINSKAKKTFCVLGANLGRIKPSIEKYAIEILENSDFKNGLSTSITIGIEYIKSKDFDSALIMLADQPKVDTPYLNSLIDIFQKNPEKIIASNYSGSFGVPAIFPKSVFEQLIQLEGDKGAKEFLNSLKGQVIAINSSQLIDIDTPKDYKDFLGSQ